MRLQQTIYTSRKQVEIRGPRSRHLKELKRTRDNPTVGNLVFRVDIEVSNSGGSFDKNLERLFGEVSTSVGHET